jgi:dihydrofolate reductase
MASASPSKCVETSTFVGGIRFLRAVRSGEGGIAAIMSGCCASSRSRAGCDSMVSSFCAPIPTGGGALRRWLGLGALLVESHAMGLLTFGLNVTLDGCIDHTQGIVDDELHDYWTQLMDQSGAMLFGRNTYELMEGAWPAVARDEKAPRAMREWAQKLEAKAKYVVSGSRSDFPWQNTIKVEGDLREAISALKAKTERGVLVGAPKLAAALEELGLIDEYRIVVHPIISGRGPTLFHGLSSARHLELLSTQRFKSGVQALHFRRKAG